MEKGHRDFEEPEQASSFPHSASESDSEEDLSSYQDASLPQVLLEAIGSIIDRLYRLAFKIRNPALRIGLQKCLNDRQTVPESEKLLIESFRQTDVARITDILLSHRSNGSIYKDSFLVSRLANANTNRRRQFAYWKYRKARADIQSNLGLTGIGAAIPKPSTASSLNTDDFAYDTKSISSEMSSNASDIPGSDITDRHVAIPRPPSLQTGAKEFECPYCYTILSSKSHRGVKWE